jgi:anthranilate synthase component 2
MILIIDNYDSFSYNLYQYVGALDPDVRVVRNDDVTVADIRALNPSHVILSPGPGYPKDAGVCVEAAANLDDGIRVLGVCLGHQAICEAFGATVSHAKKLMHGKQSDISLDGSCPLFAGLPARIRAGRYHSFAAARETLPDCLKVVAEADDLEVMAVMHKERPVYGVQFHPESILTPDGMKIIENFLAL